MRASKLIMRIELIATWVGTGMYWPTSEPGEARSNSRLPSVWHGDAWGTDAARGEKYNSLARDAPWSTINVEATESSCRADNPRSRAVVMVAANRVMLLATIIASDPAIFGNEDRGARLLELLRIGIIPPVSIPDDNDVSGPGILDHVGDDGVAGLLQTVAEGVAAVVRLIPDQAHCPIFYLLPLRAHRSDMSENRSCTYAGTTDRRKVTGMPQRSRAPQRCM